LFSPPKFDLSNSALDEFQQPEFEGYGPKTSNSISEDISNKANCNYHQRERVVSWNTYTRVNDNYFTKKVHPSAHRNMAPRAVLMKTDLRPLNTVRPVNTAHPKPTVYSARSISPGKFDGKADEGYFVRYYVNSKAFRVFNNRTRIVEKTMHITFLENKPNVAGSGPTWIFDIDTLIKSISYKPVVIGNQSNGGAGKAGVETIPDKDYILLSLWTQDPLFSSCSKESPGDGFKPSGEEEKKDAKDPRNEDNAVLSTEEPRVNQEQDANLNSTNNINNVSPTANVASLKDNVVDKDIVYGCTDDPNMPNLEEINYLDDDENVCAEADMTNLDSNIAVSPILTTRIHKDHPVEQINGDIHSAPQTRRMTKNVTNYVARIEAIRLFLAYSSFKDFVVYQIDVKSAFLYGRIEEEVYVYQPLGFEDLEFPDKVYTVEKALYGLHQAPRACYETLSTYSLDNGFHRGLQVTQKDDGIFISQDKYVDEILKKFGFSTMKTASTPMETLKPLLNDENAEDVNVHLYRLMIGSLMYLTSSRPDIMFVVCACARFQVKPKVLHLHVVKRIFRYLKGQPKLGLWYPKDSPFVLEAYTDSDYAEPTRIVKALYDPAWVEAMQEELLQFKLQKVWILVDLLKGKKAIGTKWVFRNKKDERGIVIKNKAKIEEEVYVCQPPGFEDPDHPDKVYKVVKALYGLHQAPRAWYETLAEYLLGNGFHKGKIDQTLFIKRKKEDILLVQQFWATVKVNTVNEEEQIQALVDKKKVIITEISRKQKIKKPRRKDSELPQTSVPTEVVVDKAVYKEMYDSVERVATTVTGLYAKQDRSIIRDAAAQTRSERVSKFSNDPPLSRVNALGSGEDRLKLSELIELCTQLQSRVLSLETTKTNQALKIGSLKRRVKKLKKKANKRTHKLKRLYKIASLGDQEDASKQERIVNNLDVDEGVTLVDETQGRNDQDMFDTGVLDDEEVVAEKEVTTTNPVTTAGEVVTTAGEVVSTAGIEVSTTATTPIISMNDITLAKALAALKSAKPMVKGPSVPKYKGIVMQEPEKTAIRTTTTFLS
nr:hypothetical protein [Tanacetum cinerariifolium]